MEDNYRYPCTSDQLANVYETALDAATAAVVSRGSPVLADHDCVAASIAVLIAACAVITEHGVQCKSNQGRALHAILREYVMRGLRAAGPVAESAVRGLEIE